MFEHVDPRKGKILTVREAENMACFDMYGSQGRFSVYTSQE